MRLRNWVLNICKRVFRRTYRKIVALGRVETLGNCRKRHKGTRREIQQERYLHMSHNSCSQQRLTITEKENMFCLDSLGYPRMSTEVRTVDLY